jgi:hypothetical protein
VTAPRGPAGAWRKWSAALLLAAAAGGGCAARSPVVTGAACFVTSSSDADRVVLVSEAQQAAGAGQIWRAEFLIEARGGHAVTLELTSVGCSCTGVRQAGQRLRVGDRLTVRARGSAAVCIESQPPTRPGIMQHRAELTGRDSEGHVFTVSLASSVRTIADLQVQPDVVDVAFAGAAAAADMQGDAIALHIEQHVRAARADGLTAAWDLLPEGVTATAPESTAPPVEVRAGLWRRRWRSELRVTPTESMARESPLGLAVESLVDGRPTARGGCLLTVRRTTGVRAPRVVHFGRLPRERSALRRVQLVSLDGRAFGVTSVDSRDGTVGAVGTEVAASVEHWIDVQVAPSALGVDDVLTIRTDHPESPELQISVRGLAAGD